MTGWIIRDYFAAFHWKRSMKNFSENAYWPSIYILFVLPVVHDFYDTKEGALIYLSIAIPMFFLLMSIGTHITPQLPKIMYLCPMDRKMRREYIEKSCIFRIIITTVPGVAGIIILFANGLMNWICAAGIFLNLLIMAFIGCGALSGEKKVVLPIICVYLTLVLNILYASVLMIAQTREIPGWIKWVAFSLLVLVQIPAVWRVIKNWNRAIERAADYDKIFVTKPN